MKEYLQVVDDEQTMQDEGEAQVSEKLIKRHSKVNAHLKTRSKKKRHVICKC